MTLSDIANKVKGKVHEIRNGSSPESSQTANGRRREQVRRAQRTHRERRAEYVKSLEHEVIDLRQKQSVCVTEHTSLALVNEQLRALLTEHQIAIPGHLKVPVQHVVPGQISQAEKLREEPLLQRYTSNSSPESTTSILDVADPLSGIDFVLDLERPCLPHLLDADAQDACNHLMQFQSAVAFSAPVKFKEKVSNPSHAMDWSPHENVLIAQFERLQEFSDQLKLEGSITPIMAWQIIRNSSRASMLTRSWLNDFRIQIAPHFNCEDFGAVIESSLFDRELASALARLKE